MDQGDGSWLSVQHTSGPSPSYRLINLRSKAHGGVDGGDHLHFVGNHPGPGPATWCRRRHQSSWRPTDSPDGGSGPCNMCESRVCSETRLNRSLAEIAEWPHAAGASIRAEAGARLPMISKVRDPAAGAT